MYTRMQQNEEKYFILVRVAAFDANKLEIGIYIGKELLRNMASCQ